MKHKTIIVALVALLAVLVSGVALASFDRPDVSISNGGLDISWDAVDGASQYEVNVWEEPDNAEWVKVGTVSAPTTSYRYEDIERGRTYFVVIRATNSSGMDLLTPNAEATYAPHAPIISASLNEAGDTATISWSSVTGAEWYYVWSWSNGKWNRLGRCEATCTSKTHSGLNSGTRYFYVAVAGRSNRQSGWSNTPHVTTP